MSASNPSLNHQAAKSSSHYANGAFNYTVLIVTLPRAELMYHPLGGAVLDPGNWSVYELFVSFDVGDLSRVVTIFQS